MPSPILHRGAGVLARYREFLPVTSATPLITLGEGDTPLVRAHTLEKELGCGELYLKLEGCNPTGSFKDRGMVMAFAKAIEDGARAVICASTGNTSASAAAYAARTGLQAIVIVPGANIALGKLAQAMIYGAKVLALDGNFDQALDIVRKLGASYPVTIVNSINPFRLQGQKTGAFEICDVLGDAPDYLCIPVGNAGNITAYWWGFKEYHERGFSTKRPAMLGFEAEGAAPIVLNRVVPEPHTLATAIRIGNPASWDKAVAARDESGGLIDCVSDEEIVVAYRKLASQEGIFCEPASAATIAGLMKLVREGRVDFAGKRVVCILTGNGLKDPDCAIKYSAGVSQVAPDLDAVRQVLGW
jgi:threonine synthase